MIQWRPFLGQGLQARFIWLTLLSLVFSLTFLALALLQQWRGQQELNESTRDAVRAMAVSGVRQRGEAIATYLADSLANPLYFFDLQRIGEISRSALRQPDVSYVLVFDAQGRVVHDGSGEIPSFGEPMTDALAADAVAAESLTVQISDDLVDVSVPIRIGDQPQGGVRIGISMQAPLAREESAMAALSAQSISIGQQSLRLMIVLFVSLLAIAGLGVAWVNRGLVRPIRDLADATQQIELGNFRLALESDRQDELGGLQRGFRRMSDSIAKHDEEVRRLAYSDHLTGLPNRLAFRDRLDQRLIAAQAEGTSLSLIFIDLDDFKRINDTLGHDAGDEALEQVAVRLRQCIPYDSDPDAQVARFGGDEFVAVVASDEPATTARQFAELILNELQRPLQVRGKTVFVGASVGITLFPDDATEARTLIKNGDIAMYQAKSAGKNCLRFFNRAMDQAVGASVALEAALRGAWERDELSVHYQPIFELATRRMVGVEALLRWHHPTFGDVQPAVFVEVAEQSGLIEGIGLLVLQQACEAAAAWPADSGHLFMSVNVSARQLRSGNLPERVAQALLASGLEPGRLHLELTETAVLGDEIHASVQLARLRATGVKIWLDDFGTGFSGLSHLRRVPVDGLKIDRSFVADVTHDDDDLALTGAIIAMAHSLGITAVAEGIETEEQLGVLRDRGCLHGQGFWLARPMSRTDLMNFIQA